MTGRTHDLTAFTALNYIVATQPPVQVSLATALVALAGNFIGGLAPDLDQPTAELWRRIRGGTIISRLISPIMGGHRFISHSIIGIIAWGFLLTQFLKIAGTVLLVDMNIIWWSFMIGYGSHLIIDMLTVDGVPWLFPIPIRFGIPPFRFMRIKTGGLIEKSIIFPGLIIINGYIFYTHYSKYLDILKLYIAK